MDEIEKAKQAWIQRGREVRRDFLNESFTADNNPSMIILADFKGSLIEDLKKEGAKLTSGNQSYVSGRMEGLRIALELVKTTLPKNI